MNSLDPRVNRLPQIKELPPKKVLDQLSTYEVFVQPKDVKPFQHEGIVHAPDLEMAFILAKESLTRRFQCISLFVADTRDVYSSPITEGTISAYDLIGDDAEGGIQKFEIFHLLKRGKQQVHVGTVEASSNEDALKVAKSKFGQTKVCAVWSIPASVIRFTTPEEKDLWNTLPDKKFRDAASYKGGDKLKEFLSRQ